MKTVQQWDIRFQQQAQWTEQVRNYLFQKANISNSKRILDVGCGTGALLHNLENNKSYGIDIDFQRLLFAKDKLDTSSFTCTDAHKLPFKDNFFDTSFCHYLLLWVSSPPKILSEMIRVTKPGGKIIAIAEPDYGGRIDHPKEMIALGDMQTKALINQGANPCIGRQLNQLFSDSGLRNIEGGVVNGKWDSAPSKESWELEWEVLLSDIENELEPNKILELRNNDWQAWQKGYRVLFVPTFYAIGSTPENI